MALLLEWTIAASCGFLSGILAGVLGIGGGVILVPAFYYFFRHENLAAGTALHLAIGTSLAVIFLSSLNATRTFWKAGILSPHIIGKMIPSGLLGILLAVFIHRRIAPEQLLFLFALFLFYVAFRLWRLKKTPSGEAPGQPPSPGAIRFMLSLSGFLSGFVGTLLGVGGGVITVPMLHFFVKENLRRAFAHSTALIVVLSAAGAATQVIEGIRGGAVVGVPGTLGYIRWPWAVGAGAFSILGSSYGAREAPRTSLWFLQRAYAVLAAVIGGGLLLSLV